MARDRSLRRSPRRSVSTPSCRSAGMARTPARDHLVTVPTPPSAEQDGCRPPFARVGDGAAQRLRAAGATVRARTADSRRCAAPTTAGSDLQQCARPAEHRVVRRWSLPTAGPTCRPAPHPLERRRTAQSLYPSAQPRLEAVVLDRRRQPPVFLAARSTAESAAGTGTTFKHHAVQDRQRALQAVCEIDGELFPIGFDRLRLVEDVAV